MRAEACAAALLLACGAAGAQLAPVDPDWREVDAPPPPAVRTSGLIPIGVERSALRWGVDPATISVGADGIVRYVVVGTSDSGAVNAFYEGLRCTHGTLKVYARSAGGGNWTYASNPEWRPMQLASSRHSFEVAKAGVCQGRAPNGPASRIVRDLQSPSSLYQSR